LFKFAADLMIGVMANKVIPEDIGSQREAEVYEFSRGKLADTVLSGISLYLDAMQWDLLEVLDSKTGQVFLLTKNSNGDICYVETVNGARQLRLVDGKRRFILQPESCRLIDKYMMEQEMNRIKMDQERSRCFDFVAFQRSLSSDPFKMEVTEKKDSEPAGSLIQMLDVIKKHSRREKYIRDGKDLLIVCQGV
jgi:hypothetical protein